MANIICIQVMIQILDFYFMLMHDANHDDNSGQVHVYKYIHTCMYTYRYHYEGLS